MHSVSRILGCCSWLILHRVTFWGSLRLKFSKTRKQRCLTMNNYRPLLNRSVSIPVCWKTSRLERSLPSPSQTLATGSRSAHGPRSSTQSFYLMSSLEMSKSYNFAITITSSVLIQNCLILSKVQVGDKAKVKDARVPMSQIIEEKANITGDSANEWVWN